MYASFTLANDYLFAPTICDAYNSQVIFPKSISSVQAAELKKILPLDAVLEEGEVVEAFKISEGEKQRQKQNGGQAYGEAYEDEDEGSQGGRGGGVECQQQ